MYNPKRKILLSLVLVLLCLGGGLYYWFATAPARAAAAFVKRYHVAQVLKEQDDNKYWMEFARYVVVPRAITGTRQEYILRYEQRQNGERDLVFLDRENDDEYIPLLVWRPDEQQLEMHYTAFDTDTDNEVNVAATYTLHGTALKQEAFKYTGVAKAQAKLLEKKYAATLSYIAAHVLTPAEAQQVAKQLSVSAPRRVQAAKAAEKKRVQKIARDEKQATKSFFENTYRPQFTQTQWQEYIQLRAQQLGITIASLSFKNYITAADPSAVALPYNYDQTSVFGADYDDDPERSAYSMIVGITGCLNPVNSKNTVQAANYVLLTATTGDKYLVVIPLALYNAKTLAQHEKSGYFRNFYYLMDMSTLAADLKLHWSTEFVGKSDQPSAELISQNISFAAETD